MRKKENHGGDNFSQATNATHRREFIAWRIRKATRNAPVAIVIMIMLLKIKTLKMQSIFLILIILCLMREALFHRSLKMELLPGLVDPSVWETEAGSSL